MKGLFSILNRKAAFSHSPFKFWNEVSLEDLDKKYDKSESPEFVISLDAATATPNGSYKGIYGVSKFYRNDSSWAEFDNRIEKLLVTLLNHTGQKINVVWFSLDLSLDQDTEYASTISVEFDEVSKQMPFQMDEGILSGIVVDRRELLERIISSLVPVYLETGELPYLSSAEIRCKIIDILSDKESFYSRSIAPTIKFALTNDWPVIAKSLQSRKAII